MMPLVWQVVVEKRSVNTGMPYKELIAVRVDRVDAIGCNYEGKTYIVCGKDSWVVPELDYEGLVSLWLKSANLTKILAKRPPGLHE